jgi:HSP20 family molecular chaperone IbpA
MSLENRSSIRVAVGRPASAEARPQGGMAAEDVTQPQVYVTPPIDIHEGPDGLVLEADLPGASEENLTVQLEENVLSLHARVPSPAPDGARVLHEEYQVADFYRSFILSDEVDRGKITAELKHGVLRLVLPKAERARTRRIEIKSP